MKRRELQLTVESESRVEPALGWVRQLILKGLPAGPVRISIGRPKRTLDQNAKLWPMLHDIAGQVEWHGLRLTPEEWKDVLTAGLKKQRAVPGIDGGFVILGAYTSRMTKGELSDLIELCYAFGAEHGVVWSEPSRAAA